MKKGKSKAAEFWDHYFHDDFVRLERHADKYVGAVAKSAGGPFSFLTGAKTTGIVMPISDLRSYDYASDARFTLIAKVPSDIAVAYSAVEAQTYSYRDPAPFSPQRLAELLGEIRTAYFHDSEPGITLSSVAKALSDLVDSYTPSMAQPVAALAWFLGERRDIASAEALISVVADSDYLGGAMHFTAVNAAFDALWKINAKLRLPALVHLMHRANESGRRSIGALLSRLLSTNEMLGPDLLGPKYYQADYWASIISRADAKTQADWDRYDVNALYWEIRYLAALRLSEQDVASLRQLANDEVGIVAGAAKEKRKM